MCSHGEVAVFRFPMCGHLLPIDGAAGSHFHNTATVTCSDVRNAVENALTLQQWQLPWLASNFLTCHFWGPKLELTPPYLLMTL